MRSKKKLARYKINSNVAEIHSLPDTLKKSWIDTLNKDLVLERYENYPLVDALLDETEQQNSLLIQRVGNDSVIIASQQKVITSDSVVIGKSGEYIAKIDKKITKLERRKGFWKWLAGAFGVVATTEAGIIYLKK